MSTNPHQAFRSAAAARFVVRRKPPPSRIEGSNSMGYGVGHRGGGGYGCYGFSGPASHPHIAAIEIALFHEAVGEVPYTLMGMNVPLCEALETFLDDANLQDNREDYVLVYRGRAITKKETPRSIGLDPYDDWPVAVFEVSEVGSTRMKAQLQRMNAVGVAYRISRDGFHVQHKHLVDADSLSYIFSFLNLDDLISTTSTCVFWHNVSQRLSLLLQLKCSALPDIEYPIYLDLLADYSLRLDVDVCKARAEENRRWAMLGISKEVYPRREQYSVPSRRWGRPNMFTKAAGCTSMRTVQATCEIDELQQTMLPLRSPHLDFTVSVNEEERSQLMRQIEDYSHLEYDEKKTAKMAAVTTHLTSSTKTLPEVIKVADSDVRQISVRLFRTYFSPSMHFIFPLIANQQALNGLDFRSTNTWGVRHGSETPVGAVAWRVRKPLVSLPEDINDTLISLPTKPTLEVLFIAVWEAHRHAECGRAMVDALEVEAHADGCRYMYVEVGHEQPKAREFWGGLGFIPSREAGISKEQSFFFDHSCLRFADTEQFVKCL